MLNGEEKIKFKKKKKKKPLVLDDGEGRDAINIEISLKEASPGNCCSTNK
jgi:hypothetical protein